VARCSGWWKSPDAMPGRPACATQGKTGKGPLEAVVHPHERVQPNRDGVACEAAPAVEVDELGERQVAVVPRRVRVEFAEERGRRAHPVSPSDTVDVPLAPVR
jgi:hypothetical protein